MAMLVRSRNKTCFLTIQIWDDPIFLVTAPEDWRICCDFVLALPQQMDQDGRNVRPHRKMLFFNIYGP